MASFPWSNEEWVCKIKNNKTYRNLLYFPESWTQLFFAILNLAMVGMVSLLICKGFSKGLLQGRGKTNCLLLDILKRTVMPNGSVVKFVY